MTIDDIRKLYSETIIGTDVPRWPTFSREVIGTLLAEIDRLSSGAPLHIVHYEAPSCAVGEDIKRLMQEYSEGLARCMMLPAARLHACEIPRGLHTEIMLPANLDGEVEEVRRRYPEM
jgi:hypothetical protein